MLLNWHDSLFVSALQHPYPPIVFIKRFPDKSPRSWRRNPPQNSTVIIIYFTVGIYIYINTLFSSILYCDRWPLNNYHYYTQPARFPFLRFMTLLFAHAKTLRHCRYIRGVHANGSLQGGAQNRYYFQDEDPFGRGWSGPDTTFTTSIYLYSVCLYV